MKKTTRELVDEHENMLVTQRGFNKATMDSIEQQIKLNESILERLDVLQQKYNVLVKVVAELSSKEEQRH
jgi:hypothetical protein